MESRNPPARKANRREPDRQRAQAAREPDRVKSSTRLREPEDSSYGPVRGPRHDSSRWATIQYALGSNARTIRLCSICLVMTGGPAAAVIELLLKIHTHTR